MWWCIFFWQVSCLFEISMDKHKKNITYMSCFMLCMATNIVSFWRCIINYMTLRFSLCTSTKFKEIAKVPLMCRDFSAINLMYALLSYMWRSWCVSADLNIVLSKYPLRWVHVAMMEPNKYQNISVFFFKHSQVLWIFINIKSQKLLKTHDFENSR